MRSLYEVIRKPIISEKTTMLAELGNRYAFEVAPQANKIEIRDAVQQLFKVKVTQVRTLVMHGKVKRVGRSVVKQANKKKAVVTLAEGHKIDFFQTK
ncbi:50S ribosomal protein L23 [Bdellovibrionota bacterium FG-2]